MEDLDAAASEYHPFEYSRLAKGANDVIYNTYTGNYTMFISQLSRNETSIGYWHVGDDRSRFGRFARGFASNQDTMYFDLNDHFVDETANSNVDIIKVTITYFNLEGQSFNLLYPNDKGGLGKRTIVGSGPGSWEKVTFILDDATLNLSGLIESQTGKKSDLMLKKTNGNPLFHMIELEIDRLQDTHSHECHFFVTKSRSGNVVTMCI